MLHLIFSMPCLYVLIRFVAPLPWPLSMRIVLGAVMLIASQYHLWCRLSSGSVFSPEFPRPLVLLFNWAFGAILLFAAMLIVIDLGSLIVAVARQRMAPVPMPLRYVAAGIAGILAAIGVAQAARLPPVRDLTVEIVNLPPAFDGYRIVQLTDLHISRLFPQPWARAVVQRTNALDADLIVVTGDFIDGSVAARTRDVAPLRDLAAPDGTWFIPGNHEYFFGYEAWMRRLTGLGLRPLVNSHTVLRRGTDKLVLAGLTDLSASETGNAPPDLNAALANAPSNVAVLLLDHQPKHAPEAARKGVALQLSGHTHGGMIRGLDRIIAMANGGYVSGLYDVSGMNLYVNNGTALWPGFALRLGVGSELTRITLRPKGTANLLGVPREE
ncbi:metallophosphoesterase [Rhizobium skierniewicense]|uniref:metallophosphoesterase n=1 Tax=Rhizobium skierniewicense TaxID=984260 RepID=UPI001574AB5A|nr:metallophosphoesterase [Rhizobium skierniewicense]NTF35074.1 metallophosphoesterase [Rhizobium skierniewicense]